METSSILKNHETQRLMPSYVRETTSSLKEFKNIESNIQEPDPKIYVKMNSSS